MNPQTPEPNPSKMDKRKGIDRSLHPVADDPTNRHGQVSVRVSHAHGSRRRHPITASEEAQNHVSNFHDNRTMIVTNGAFDTNSLNTYTYDTLNESGSGGGYNASNVINSQSAFRGSGTPHRGRQQNSRSNQYDDLVDRTANLSMNNQNTGNGYTPAGVHSLNPLGHSSGVLNNSQTSAGPSRAYGSTGRYGTNQNITVMHAGPSVGSRQNNGIHHSQVDGVMNGSTRNFGNSTAQTSVHLPSGSMGSFHASGPSNSFATQGPQMTGQPQAKIPDAVVIKNIPFKLLKEQLQAIMQGLGLPTPRAFNYLFDQNTGTFGGLAFANYNTAEEATRVIRGLHGTIIWDRDLRVELKQEEDPAKKAENKRKKQEMRGQTLEYHQPLAPGTVTVPPYIPPRGYSYLDPSPFSQPSTSTRPLNPTAAEFQPGSSYQLLGSAGLLDDTGIEDEHFNFPRSTSPAIDLFNFDGENQRRQLSRPSTSTAYPNPFSIESQLSGSTTMADLHPSPRQNGLPREIPMETIRRRLISLPPSSRQASRPANRQPMPAPTNATPTRIETRPYMRESWRNRADSRLPVSQPQVTEQQEASTLSSQSRPQQPPGLPTPQPASMAASPSQNTRRSSPGDPDYEHPLIRAFPAPAVAPTDAQPETVSSNGSQPRSSPTTSSDTQLARAHDPWFNAIWTRNADSQRENRRQELERAERDQAERAQGTDTGVIEDELADENEELNINHTGSGETWLSLGRAFKRDGKVKYRPVRRSAA